MNAAILTLTPKSLEWPHVLDRRLGPSAPKQLHLLGPATHLDAPLTALLCSARWPGDVILRTYDQAGRWRGAGQTVISGFHSPMERECLRILLRGRQGIVICPARGIPQRVSLELRPALSDGRLLFVTPFNGLQRRITASLAEQRNLLVAALASEIWFAHVTPGGQMDRLARQITQWLEPPRQTGALGPLVIREP